MSHPIDNPLVKDINLRKGMKTDELIKEFYAAGGFTAKSISSGVNILEKMYSEKNCFTFLSFPACICATGCRGVIKDLIKRKIFDAVITTTGTLDHDIARIWKDYFHGSFMADDKALHKNKIYRLGNIFIPQDCYGTILEEKITPMIKDIFKDKSRISTKEFIWELGKKLANEKRSKESIVYWAWKNKIPIYIPGITDGAIGLHLWSYYQEHRNLTVDLFKDEQELSDIVFEAKKTGALIIGGGISKHHTLWWNQFKGGLDYAVYITTAVEYDGSLSGAHTREAISWGKIRETADSVSINGDATVILPLMTSSLIERL